MIATLATKNLLQSKVVVLKIKPPSWLRWKCCIKRDPGELFPWSELAARGLALAPGTAPPRAVDALRARELLQAIGYVPDPPEVTLPMLLRAFQRRFRQQRVDGVLDAETMGLLEAAAALSEGARSAKL